MDNSPQEAKPDSKTNPAGIAFLIIGIVMFATGNPTAVVFFVLGVVFMNQKSD